MLAFILDACLYRICLTLYWKFAYFLYEVFNVNHLCMPHYARYSLLTDDYAWAIIHTSITNLCILDLKINLDDFVSL